MKQIIFISTVCTVLAACGGGGGSSNPASNTASAEIGAAVALNNSNYEPAAKEIVGSASSLQSTGSVAQNLLTGVQVNTMISPFMFLRERLPELAQHLKQRANLTGVQYTDVVDCPDGGKMDVTGNDNNNNDELDTGDSVALILSSCQYGRWKITGKMDFNVIRGTSTSEMTTQNIKISASISDFKSEIDDIAVVGNGTFTLDVTPASPSSFNVAIVTPLMTSKITQAGTSKVFQYKDYTITAIADLNFTEWAIKGNVSVPTLGANTADVNSKTPFNTPSDKTYPTVGELLINVSNGGKMRVTATGTSNAKVELDLNSDGNYEENKLVSWIDVL